MDGGVEIVEILKPVFDSCDISGDGFVVLDDLLRLGKQHAFENLEELEPILKQLDPNGHGKITFEDFCSRVKEITNMEQEARIDTDHQVFAETRPRSYTDSEGFFEDPDSPSHSTASTNDYCADLDDYLTSPARDVQHIVPLNNNNNNTVNSEVHGKTKDFLSIYSTYPLNGMHKHKKRHRSIFQSSNLLGHPMEHASKEEGFEGIGEGSDCDETLSVNSDYSTPDNSRSLYMRRVSGSSVARRLRMVHSAHCSLHNSNDELYLSVTNHNHNAHSDSECQVMELAGQIKSLSSQVTNLQLDQEDHREKQLKSKIDNRKLLERITILEEQLHEARSETKESVGQESQKYSAALSKLQREHEKQLHQIQSDLKAAEHKIAELSSVEPMLRKELEICIEDRRFAQQKIDELNELIIEKDRMLSELRHRLRLKSEEFERLRNDKLQEIAALTEELETARDLKHNAEMHFDEKNQLIQEIDRLKMENDKLKNTKDDLRDQLMQHKAFFEQEKQRSLADELLTADKEEVLNVLKQQENSNHRMRQYIDMLLMLIMESNPELLEKM